jgi:NTE family protein
LFALMLCGKLVPASLRPGAAGPIAAGAAQSLAGAGRMEKGGRVDGELGGRRVAIACEGGGSHTAFTAGVLRRLLREPVEVVALSGTSGGAVCAALAWRGLVAGDRDDAVRRLEAFWDDNASEGLEALWETWVRLGARLVGEVVSAELSPYSYAWDALEPLRELLERHCGFAELPALLDDNPSAQRLLIGAADVQSGDFAVFRSHPVTHRGESYPAADINAEVILASAAVPTLFRAVEIDGRYYWDGVFAQNPPIRELPDLVRTLPGGAPPDEIWLVRINPKKRAGVPRSIAEIRDRRNELAGIISLEQELYLIELLNRLVAAGELDGTKHEQITLRSITMSDEFAARLDYESKLERGRPFLDELERHGRQRAEAFLRHPDRHLEPEGAQARPERRSAASRRQRR